MFGKLPPPACPGLCYVEHFFGYSNVTLWLFNIAMDNGPFIDGLPIIYKW